MKHQDLHRIGRGCSVLLAAVLSLTLLPQPFPLHAETAVREVNNIVLFAQFGDPEAESFMDAARTKLISESCTRTDTLSSLHGYIDAISYGQMQTACYFPQLEGDTVQPYILTHAPEDYTRESLALEVIRNVSIPAELPLDGDGDGVIDNFILVIDGTAASQKDMLWPHMSSLAYAGVRINGKTVDTYNIHNSGSLFGSVVNPVDIGTICHEFLHSVGYPDLYRGAGAESGTPVGAMWDIMAGTLKSSLVAPLAYLRASRSGWLEAADITENGTYTLAPASAASGSRLYLLRSPASDAEFFAVEFRKQGADLHALDGVCGSGLLVYRVNPASEGNRDSDVDEIYLFRPENSDQTGQANYGGEGRADCIGSLDPDAGIADGALTFSNGVNSGIRIENITIEGDALTFDVQFAEIDRQSGWYAVPNDAELDVPGTLDLAVSESGAVYLAGSKRSNRAAGLYRISETGCEHITDLTVSGNVYEVQLAVAGETPYLLYRDADYRAVLCAYDPAAAEWRTLWQSKTLAQYTDIAANGDAVYLCYTEGDYPSYVLRTLCYANSEMTQLGDVLSRSACDPSLVCTDGAAAVAYRDVGDSSLPKLTVWEQDHWTQITLADASCSRLCAASDGSAVTVAVTGKGAGLYTYQDGLLTAAAYPVLPGDPYAAAPLYVNGALTAAVCTQNADQYALYRCDSWSICGNRIEAQYVIDPHMAASGNTVYAAYQLSSQTGSGSLVIKTMRLGTELPGDVNADGVLTAEDAILLRQWLLTVPGTVLGNRDAADLNGDGRLDASDLSLLKRAISVQRHNS